MDYSEESDHAFIIRIWKENREFKQATPTWRGVIEHVPSGKKRYLEDLAQIITFINPYIVEMGLKTSVFWRLAVQFRKLKGRLQRPISRPVTRKNDTE